MSPTARVDDRGQMRKFPEVERTGGRHRSRSTSERFGLDPPFVGPHAPTPTAGGRTKEVDVGAVRSHRGVATELPAPVDQVHLVDVVHDQHQMRNPDHRQGQATLTTRELDLWDLPRGGNRREMQLGHVGRG